ncbi:YncE family protein [Paenibacillus antri]|uniref:YncE family protein n=1 Tax=Paenibacillus antri TaxID=2582848 RepID=A0A5R9GA87_9BACL|nr:YncE family protein [Paenibacillus antri]TLS49994.1 YncE family protein [Paenibacillus antri]
MRKILAVIAALILITGCVQGGERAEQPTPQQTSGDNTQDPVDESSSGWLFTANEGGSITRIDLTDNKVTASIEATGSVHNVQLSPDGKVLAATVVPEMNDEDSGHAENGDDAHGHGMTMNGLANFYDAASGNLIESVEVGQHPAHVVYTSDGKLALVTNNEGNNVSIIDTSTYTVVDTIPTGKGPHGFRISADNRFAYIANMGEDTVSVIDLIERKENRRIKVGAAPVTTSVTSDGKLLAVTLNAENALAVVTLATDQIEKIGVGSGPAQVYIQSDNLYAFVANQGTADNPSRTVSKIDLADKKTVATIETGAGAHGVITSADTKKIYVTNMFENTLSIIDNETHRVIDTLQTGEMPNGITISP